MADMNPDDPHVAQQIVAAYVSVLERHEEQQTLPAPVSALPYARDTIKQAIRASLQALAGSGQLTDELREFLEHAYVALADFLDDELVRLMRDYNRAADDLSQAPQTTGERVKTSSWQTLQRTSGLAGEIARSVAADAAHLRREFAQILADPVSSTLN
jgi:hypothetical protein